MSTTADQPPAALTNLKERARAAWAAGDYPTVARHLSAVGERLVRRLAIRPGEDVIDVACGAGNAAIPAARTGAHVTGLDLTPELFRAAREAARAAEVEVEWQEGDAEALPYGDKRFDVVMSTFGCMFAPRHDVTAGELVRVLRPHGRLGLCSWTPEGNLGGFFGLVSQFLPPPPEPATPPLLWGTEAHVRSLFTGSGLAMEFAREVVDFRFASVSDIVEFYTTLFGPVVTLRALLEKDGRWPDFRAELYAFFEGSTVPYEGGISWPGEYLVVIGRRG